MLVYTVGAHPLVRQRLCWRPASASPSECVFLPCLLLSTVLVCCVCVVPGLLVCLPLGAAVPAGKRIANVSPSLRPGSECVTQLYCGCSPACAAAFPLEKAGKCISL